MLRMTYVAFVEDDMTTLRVGFKWELVLAVVGKANC